MARTNYTCAHGTHSAASSQPSKPGATVDRGTRARAKGSDKAGARRLSETSLSPEDLGAVELCAVLSVQ